MIIFINVLKYFAEAFMLASGWLLQTLFKLIGKSPYVAIFGGIIVYFLLYVLCKKLDGKEDSGSDLSKYSLE